MSFIISKTPLRVSFFSGGDMEAFYKREPGHCLSTTVQLYVYVTMLTHRDGGLRFQHETTEDVTNLADLKNEIARDCFNLYEYTNFQGTVTSMSTVKASGNGLGSSSAFTVGLLNILEHYSNGRVAHRWVLAEKACRVEIDRLKKPIGKQDQYAAAIGGLNFFTFDTDGTVHSEVDSRVASNLYDHQEKFCLVHTGISHNASEILLEQNKTIIEDKTKFDLLKANAYRARMGYELLKRDKINDFGELLHEAWMDKKAITDGISNSKIDELYEYSLKAGATGGKIIGAGGGGFLLLYFPYWNHRANFDDYLHKDFPQCTYYPLRPTDKGSTIIDLD